MESASQKTGTGRSRKMSKKPSKRREEPEPVVELNFVKELPKDDDTLNLYLSYATDDRPIVKQINARLKEQKNVIPWYDKDQIPNGWNFDICMKAIERCDLFLLFMSPHYKESDSCRSEALHAKFRDKDVLIVKLQHPCEPSGWIEPVCANKNSVLFSMKYRSFDIAMLELNKQIRIMAEKIKAPKDGKPSSPTPSLQRFKSLDSIVLSSTFDNSVIRASIDRMKLRRFDALKLVQVLRTFNQNVFDIDFLEAIKRAEANQLNGSIVELCKRLARTEGKAFVLTARAARQSNMHSLAEAIEDTIIELCLEARKDDIIAAAKLLSQLFEGFDALHMKKRKGHVVDMAKKANADLYQELVEVANLKRRDTIQRLFTTGKRLRRFGKIPVPDREDGIVIRAKNAEILRSSIRTLCEEKEGFLAVVGSNGLGKSLLVSRLVLDDEYIVKECMIDIVAWLNVYELSKSGVFIEERQFYLQLAEAIGITINLQSELSIERQLERYLSGRDKSILIVLENVYSSNIVMLTAFFDKYLRVITISPDQNCVAAACNRYRSQVVEFEKVTQAKVESFFVEKLPPTIDRLQITSLAMLCDGLPLLAKMVAAQFVNCKERLEAALKYRLLVDKNPDKGQFILSPRDSSDKLNQEKVEATISSVFHLNFEREPRELFRRYSAFLWFGVDEIVEQGDIALLWGCDVTEVAPYCLEHFVTKSLIQVVDVFESAPEAPKRQCFQLHGLLHNVVVDFAKKKAKAARKYSLADLTLQAGRNYPDRRDGENILHLAARLHKRAIFTAVVNFVAEDAELLLALCQEKDAMNGLTPIDYLAAEEWKDEKEFHLYRDTALGLLFLLYDRMAMSKVKPGFQVEVVIARVKGMLDYILAKILAKVEDKDEPLLLAARENLGALAAVLLERGAFPNVRDRDDGHTALTLFARHGNEAMVRLLLQGHKTIHANDKTLHWAGLGLVKAASAGRYEVVRFLLERGASPDSLDDDGECALVKSIKNQNVALVQLLLEHGADPNVIERNIHTERFNPSKNVSALMIAVELGNEEICKLLLHHFADPMAKNSYNETALMMAMKRNNKAIVDILRNRCRQV